MAGSAFPLDAEQIVRLFAIGLARTLNALRQRDEKPISEDELLLCLADDAGIALPVRTDRYGRRWPLPYGSASVRDEGLTPSEKRSADPRPGSGSSPRSPQASRDRSVADV